MKYNAEVSKLIMQLDNSDENKTLINFDAIFTTNKSCDKLTQMVTISLPENANDLIYRRTIFKTRINVCRMAIVQSRYFIRVFMENCSKVSNYEMNLQSSELNSQNDLFVFLSDVRSYSLKNLE